MHNLGVGADFFAQRSDGERPPPGSGGADHAHKNSKTSGDDDNDDDDDHDENEDDNDSDYHKQSKKQHKFLSSTAMGTSTPQSRAAPAQIK